MKFNYSIILLNVEVFNLIL